MASLKTHPSPFPLRRNMFTQARNNIKKLETENTVKQHKLKQTILYNLIFQQKKKSEKGEI